MPYCPLCKRDYEEGVTVCAFCEADLVDELPEEEEEVVEITDGITVYTTYSPVEADSIKKYLAEEGILCQVIAEDCSGGIAASLKNAYNNSGVLPSVETLYRDATVKFDIIVENQDKVSAAEIIENKFGDGLVNYVENEIAPIENSFRISAFADEASPDIDAQIEALKNAGLCYIDLRNVLGKSCVDLSEEEAALLKEKLDSNGIKVSCLASPIGKIGITDHFEKELDRFKNGLKVAKALDTKYIRIFSFFMSDGEKWFRRREVMKRIKALLDAAEGSGITVLHENEKGIYGSTVKDCLDIHRTFKNRDFGMIFDPANFIQCGETPIDAWDDTKKYVKYLHIKDAYFGNGEVVPAGYGDATLPDILRDAADMGDIFLSVEPHLSVTPWMEGIIDKEKFPVGDGNDAPALFDLACRSLKEVLDGVDHRE